MGSRSDIVARLPGLWSAYRRLAAIVERRLGVHPSKHREPESQPVPGSRVPPRPTIVYIVDDDGAVRSGLAKLLQSAGMEPRTFDSAVSFLANVTNQEHACILLDITMPRMTGLQVQSRLGQLGIDLPVITVSARDDEETRRNARRLGARMFLRKPVDDQALLDAIQWVTHAGPPSPK